MYGKTLKTIRNKIGISQQEIADLIGTSRANISKIELGEHDLSELYKCKIEEKFNIKFSDYEELPEDEEVKEISKMLKANPENMKLILDCVYEETDLMLLASKAIKGDSVALERFIKLVR